jgi:hypothetical protein
MARSERKASETTRSGAKDGSTKNGGRNKTPKQGRLSQLRQVFTMTRRSDPAVVWWMALAFVIPVLVLLLVGLLVHMVIYLVLIGVMLGVLAAMIVLARRAERAAYSQIAGQPGASVAALRTLRRGWNVEEQPVAVDPRTQDLVFRAVGRPGVVLVTEGPLPRAGRLAETERKRIARILPNVPIHIVHSGDEEGQVPLRKLTGKLGRMKPSPQVDKNAVSEIARRLHAMGAVRPPIPKGVDPMRMRPDRKGVKGR